MFLVCGVKGNRIKERSRMPVTYLVILFGFASMVTRAYAVTQLYTDGEMHVLWETAQNGDEKGSNRVQSKNNKTLSPLLPKNVTFCIFGKFEPNDEAMTGLNVIRVSSDTVLDLIKACQLSKHGQDTHKRRRRSLRRQRRSINFNFLTMYPGTKWCGAGNYARWYGDLGRLRAVDTCCRQHDHCPNTLTRGQGRGGIINRGAFTLSHCDCDENFRWCLRRINSIDSNMVGHAFFDLIRLNCFAGVRGSNWRLRFYSNSNYFD